MLKNNIQKNRLGQQVGFTMIELLIATVIMALLVGLAIASHRTGQKKYTLSQAAQGLVSDLRKAQNMAMSGVDIEGGQYCGYGIYLEENDSFYIIYGDKAADCESSNNKYDGSDVVMETISLPDKIDIQAVSPLPNKVDIFFKPPDPTTYINANDGAGISGTITLELEGASLTKIITVTTAGLIYSD